MLLENCPICGEQAKQVCSGCRQVKYCGADHQKQHWRDHKKVCRPYRVQEDPVLGRFLVATHNIARGQVIFVEEPLVVGPKWYQSEAEQQAIIVSCIACYKPCRLGKHLCPNCRWPVCSEQCPAIFDNQQHMLECTVLSLGPGPAHKSDTRGLHDYYRMDAVLVLRCLLLQRQHPKRWAALLEMQSHESNRVGTELYQDAERRVVSFLQKIFMRRLRQIEQKSREKFLEDYDSALMHRLCGIIETNYMCIQLSTGIELSGLFRTACMMEHACRPNCYFQFDNQRSHAISVIAGCDIAKGDHLKISYTNILWGTQLRLHHLALTKHFCCHCERCRDPTEYGTYLSALRCLGDVNKTCGGWQLPLDPLDENTDWKCDTCPMIVNAHDVAGMLSEMTEDVDALIARKPNSEEVEAQLQRLTQFLHPNHYHMFNLKHTLIQIYGSSVDLPISQLTDTQLARKLHLCAELENVCLKLDPHTIKLSVYMAIILYEMARGKKQQARRKLIAEPTLKAEVRRELEVVHEVFERAVNVLEKELDSVAGKKMSEKLQQEIFKLDKFILTIDTECEK